MILQINKGFYLLFCSHLIPFLFIVLVLSVLHNNFILAVEMLLCCGLSLGMLTRNCAYVYCTSLYLFLRGSMSQDISWVFLRMTLLLILTQLIWVVWMCNIKLLLSLQELLIASLLFKLCEHSLTIILLGIGRKHFCCRTAWYIYILNWLYDFSQYTLFFLNKVRLWLQSVYRQRRFLVILLILVRQSR